MQTKEKCVGYIQLVFFDHTTEEVITLGGAGFRTREEDDAEWANIPAFSGESSFLADHMDAEGVIYEDKRISAETCTHLMGKSIDVLIAEGRKKLVDELAKYS